MIYTVGLTPYRVIQIKTLSLFQANSQNNDQILTFYIVLHHKHDNFYVPVTPS